MKKNSIDMLIDGYTARHKRNLKLHVLTQSCTQSLDDFISEIATRRRKRNPKLYVVTQSLDDFMNNPEVEVSPLKEEVINNDKKE